MPVDVEDRLHRVLLRAQAIVYEAMGRHITNQAMLQQLDMVRDAMYRGYYMLDSFSCQPHDEGTKDKAVRVSSPLSKVNSLKRLSFSTSTRRVVLKQLQETLDDLNSIILDVQELVVFLMSYPRMPRQPYSMHLQLANCMFDRQVEAQFVINFLLNIQPHEDEGVGVLPIVGPGQVGKSTLVAHVCKDERTLTFESMDPEMHPRLTHLAIEIAKTLGNSSIIAANVTARLLRDNLNIHFWCKVLNFLRGFIQKHVSRFGEHPINFLNENRPAHIARMATSSEEFMIHHRYQCSPEEEVPQIRFEDVIKMSKPMPLDVEDCLRRVLLRAQVIIDEAMGRHITNHSMLLQLVMLRDAMHRGYYTLDNFRYQPHNDEDIKDQADRTQMENFLSGVLVLVELIGDLSEDAWNGLYSAFEQWCQMGLRRCAAAIGGGDRASSVRGLRGEPERALRPGMAPPRLASGNLTCRGPVGDSRGGRRAQDRMAHPRFPLLELEYDDTHRAHMIADQNMVLPWLRTRVHAPMHWDSRYAPKMSKPMPLDVEDCLRRVLLRAQVIIEEAMGRHITNHAMLLQLLMLRDAMHRGHYTLDNFRYQPHDNLTVMKN
nr:unnamed protein product [Digitaria exilis]